MSTGIRYNDVPTDYKRSILIEHIFQYMVNDQPKN